MAAFDDAEQALRYLVMTLGCEGQVDGAIEINRQVLAKLPHDVSTMLNLAKKLAARQQGDDVEEARALVLRARELRVSDYG